MSELNYSRRDQARYCGVRVYFGSVMSGSYVGEYVRKMLQDTTSAEPRMLSCHQCSGFDVGVGEEEDDEDEDCGMGVVDGNTSVGGVRNDDSKFCD